MITVLDHLFVLGFALLLPVYERFVPFSKLKRDLAAGRRKARTGFYKKDIAAHWILAALVLALGVIGQRTLVDVGLGIPAGWRFWLGIGLAAVGCVAVTWQRRLVISDTEDRKEMRAQLKDGVSLLPRSPGEFTWYAILAITTGVCEELVYRGYLLWYLQEATIPPLAIAGSCVLYGFSHLYQNLRGMLQTMILGLAFVGLYYVSGTLWAPMLLHAFLDFSGGLLSRELVPTKR